MESSKAHYRRGNGGTAFKRLEDALAGKTQRFYNVQNAHAKHKVVSFKFSLTFVLHQLK